MKILFQNKLVFLIINVVCSFLFFFLLAQSYTLVHYINILFFISSAYMMIWLVAFVIRGRFFDGVVFGFRRFSGRVIQRDLLDDWATKTMPSEKISARFSSLILFQALSLTAIMIILLILFYV